MAYPKHPRGLAWSCLVCIQTRMKEKSFLPFIFSQARTDKPFKRQFLFIFPLPKQLSWKTGPTRHPQLPARSATKSPSWDAETFEEPSGEDNLGHVIKPMKDLENLRDEMKPLMGLLCLSIYVLFMIFLNQRTIGKRRKSRSSSWKTSTNLGVRKLCILMRAYELMQSSEDLSPFSMFQPPWDPRSISRRAPTLVEMHWPASRAATWPIAGNGTTAGHFGEVSLFPKLPQSPLWPRKFHTRTAGFPGPWQRNNDQTRKCLIPWQGLSFAHPFNETWCHASARKIGLLCKLPLAN